MTLEFRQYLFSRKRHKMNHSILLINVYNEKPCWKITWLTHYILSVCPPSMLAAVQ